MPSYYVAFWNLENLFDVDGSPARPEWLQRALARELAGWNTEVLDLKISQLARIIRQMNGGAGPDVLGVCEIENEHVLRLLIDALALTTRDYDVAHADTSDERGIDVAFLFDRAIFEKREQFSQVILATQRHARPVPGNARHQGERARADHDRQPLARTLGGRVRVRAVSHPGGRDARLLARAHRRHQGRRHAGAGDGRLQRRAVQSFARPICAQHLSGGQGAESALAALLQPDVAPARAASGHALLRQFRQPARPVPGLTTLARAHGADPCRVAKACASRPFRKWSAGATIPRHGASAARAAAWTERASATTFRSR